MIAPRLGYHFQSDYQVWKECLLRLYLLTTSKVVSKYGKVTGYYYNKKIKRRLKLDGSFSLFYGSFVSFSANKQT